MSLATQEMQEAARAELRALEAAVVEAGPAGGGRPPPVIQLIEAIHDTQAGWLYLVTPYAEGGDLFRLLQAEGGGLPSGLVRCYSRQIATGLLFLKRRGLAHGYV
jgi:serine/threonine protein kinase